MVSTIGILYDAHSSFAPLNMSWFGACLVAWLGFCFVLFCFYIFIFKQIHDLIINLEEGEGTCSDRV